MVRPMRLAYAVEHGQAGIWGGTTEDERRAMRTQNCLDTAGHMYAETGVSSPVP